MIPGESPPEPRAVGPDVRLPRVRPRDHGRDRLAEVIGESVAIREGWLVEEGGARCWRISAPTPSTSRALGVVQARKTGRRPSTLSMTSAGTSQLAGSQRPVVLTVAASAAPALGRVAPDSWWDG
jgi:hypothetical protein